jgi:hypothetical protein
MSALVYTLNIIETNPNGDVCVRAYAKTPEGNEEAENMFTRMVYDKQPDYTLGQLVDILDDRYYAQGKYSITLVYST